MRKPSRGEMGALIGALGAGAVGVHIVEKPIEAMIEKNKGNTVRGAMHDLRILVAEGEAFSKQLADGGVGIQYGEHHILEETMKEIVEQADEWKDTPLAPEIVHLLEKGIEIRHKGVSDKLYRDVIKLRREHKEAWGNDPLREN